MHIMEEFCWYLVMVICGIQCGDIGEILWIYFRLGICQGFVCTSPTLSNKSADNFMTNIIQQNAGI
jgi:hypothetical protein